MVVVQKTDVFVLIKVIRVVVVFINVIIIIKIVILWTCLEDGRTLAGVVIVERNGDVFALDASIGIQTPPASLAAVAVRIASSTFSFLVWIVIERTFRVARSP